LEDLDDGKCMIVWRVGLGKHTGTRQETGRKSQKSLILIAQLTQKKGHIQIW
jgi:hypothetical protein